MSYWQKVTYSSTSMTLSCNRGYKVAEDSVNMTTFSHGRKTYKICNYPYAKQFFLSLLKFEDSKVMKDNKEYYFSSYCILRTSRQENRRSFDFHGSRSRYKFLSCSFH